MAEIGDGSATLARYCYRRASQLLGGCIEGGLHAGARGRCLHSGEERIEFTA
jgi:hypothetical protein